MNVHEMNQRSSDLCQSLEDTNSSENTSSGLLNVNTSAGEVVPVGKGKKKGSKLFAGLKLKKHLSANKKFQKLFADKFCLDSNSSDRLLINEFNCALLRNKSLLIQGTFYTTRKYFAFHANIFGFETYLIKKWTEVSFFSRLIVMDGYGF